MSEMLIALLVITFGGILFSLTRGWIRGQLFTLLVSWRSASIWGKILLPLLVVVDIFAGGGMSPDGRSLNSYDVSLPSIQMVDVVRGYNAPIEGVPDEDVFIRPDEAFTPLRWQGLGVNQMGTDPDGQ